MKLQEYIDSLVFDTYYRGDCPECNGNNTFSVRREGSRVLYHCFRASCKLSGQIQKEMDHEELRTYFGENSGLHDSRWACPASFCAVYRADTSNFFRYYPSIFKAYSDGIVDLRYDPQQHRIVFLLKEGDECYGAVGRSLHRSITPKWFVYGNRAGHPFICHSKSTTRQVVVVEDCISACTVSSICDGLGLLSTNLTDASISACSAYDRCIVALDKDASRKAIDLQRHLSFYVKDVDILLLERDLKYENEETLKKVLENV